MHWICCFQHLPSGSLLSVNHVLRWCIHSKLTLPIVIFGYHKISIPPVPQPQFHGGKASYRPTNSLDHPHLYGCPGGNLLPYPSLPHQLHGSCILSYCSCVCTDEERRKERHSTTPQSTILHCCLCLHQLHHIRHRGIFQRSSPNLQHLFHLWRLPFSRIWHYPRQNVRNKTRQYCSQSGC